MHMIFDIRADDPSAELRVRAAIRAMGAREVWWTRDGNPRLAYTLPKDEWDNDDTQKYLAPYLTDRPVLSVTSCNKQYVTAFTQGGKVGMGSFRDVPEYEAKQHPEHWFNHTTGKYFIRVPGNPDKTGGILGRGGTKLAAAALLEDMDKPLSEAEMGWAWAHIASMNPDLLELLRKTLEMQAGKNYRKEPA